MRRTVALCAAGALIAVPSGIALADAGSARDDRAGDGRPRSHVVHVTRTNAQDVMVDIDRSATAEKPAPDSIGDEDVFTADFHRGDRKVGFDGGVCKLVRLPALFHCIATNALPKGDLTVQFLADFQNPRPGNLAITGGTGRYKGAAGEVVYVDNPDPQPDDVTFRFTTP